MTTTVVLPPHGTPARARGRNEYGIPRCSCRPCRTAENRYNKRRNYLIATGQRLLIPAGPSAAHLRKLFAEGAGWQQLAATIGMSTSTISKLLNGQQVNIRRVHAERILATTAAEAIAPARPVDATGSIRRVRALMAIGHMCKNIAAAGGIERTALVALVNGNATRVQPRTAAQVRTAYKKLAYVQGTSVRSRNRALRENWPSPLRWDDDTIDNPNATPDAPPTGPDAALKRDDLAALRREEVWLLVTAGLRNDEIAARIGLAPTTVRDIRAAIYTGRKRDRSKQVAA